MSKAIIVETKGNEAVGTVADKGKVTLPNAKTNDTKIHLGVKEIEDIFSGNDSSDPTAMKKCSRCIKMGRQPFHPIGDFSLLKNGKRHSQCKVCRVEQSDIWCRNAPHRKEYQRNYQKNRKYAPRTPKAVRILMDAPTEKQSNKLDATSAVFVAFSDDSKVQDTQ